MREGNYSLESIGLLQLIKLPWILKLFWAPLVDDKTSMLRDYKNWIISSEFFYAVVIIAIGFLNLKTDFPLVIALMVIAITASATQDIATDALSIHLMKGKDRSLGASMQSMGSFIGTLVGGGVLLVIYHHFGWKSLLTGLAGFVLLALIPLATYRKELNQSKSASQKKIRLIELIAFFKQENISKQIIFLIFYYAGITCILAMLRPYLVDLGYSMKEIGFLFGILGTSAATVCSFLAGFLVRRIGKYKCRVLFAFATVLSTSYIFWISLGHATNAYIYSGVILLWITYGLATVVVYTTAMDLAREGREGTDFTLQTVLTHLSGMILAVLSGHIAQRTSYTGLFIFGVSLSLISFIYNLVFYKNLIRKDADAS